MREWINKWPVSLHRAILDRVWGGVREKKSKSIDIPIQTLPRTLAQQEQLSFLVGSPGFTFMEKKRISELGSLIKPLRSEDRTKGWDTRSWYSLWHCSTGMNNLMYKMTHRTSDCQNPHSANPMAHRPFGKSQQSINMWISEFLKNKPDFFYWYIKKEMTV